MSGLFLSFSIVLFFFIHLLYDDDSTQHSRIITPSLVTLALGRPSDRHHVTSTYRDDCLI
jgi:hypothetical protein